MQNTRVQPQPRPVQLDADSRDAGRISNAAEVFGADSSLWLQTCA